MTYIFVSYAHKDIKHVKRILKEINSLGFDYWMDDRNLQGGDYWTEEITEAILGSDKFLLVMSAASMESDHVGREVQIAFENKIKILILKLEDAEIPVALKYPLARIQWIDHSKPDWKSQLSIALGKVSRSSTTKTDRASAKLPSKGKVAVRKKKQEPKLKVFLCHSSGDKQVVKSLYNRLLSEKYIDPWLDQEKLLPGENWDFEIKKAVSESDVVIVCLSKQSINKEGYVQKEIKLALDVADEKPEGAIFLIPVKLEECKMPTRLSTLQWLNYFEDIAYEKLLQSLRKRAERLDIKTEYDKSKGKLSPPLITNSSHINKANVPTVKTDTEDLKKQKVNILLQSMLQEKALKRNIHNVSKAPADIQAAIFRETLKDLEEYLDTGDLRKLTGTSLSIIRDDILGIIKCLRNLEPSQIYGHVRSLDGILEKLRDARDSLQISLALFDVSGQLNERKGKDFFAELRSVRKSIAEALKLFR